MKLYAPNAVVARSRFNYYMTRLEKAKKSNCQILKIRNVWNHLISFRLFPHLISFRNVIHSLWRIMVFFFVMNLVRVPTMFTRNTVMLQSAALWNKCVCHVPLLCFLGYIIFSFCFNVDAEMASRHAAQRTGIHIISVTRLRTKDCKRPNVTAFHVCISDLHCIICFLCFLSS